VAGLLRAVVPPADFARMQAAYDIKRTMPLSDKDRAEFEENIARFALPDAVDTLMAEFEPALIEARPKAPGALLMGFGAMQMALASPDTDLSDDQRATLQAALPGLQQWASSTDFL